jgi:hypothetical protein
LNAQKEKSRDERDFEQFMPFENSSIYEYQAEINQLSALYDPAVPDTARIYI